MSLQRFAHGLPDRPVLDLLGLGQLFIGDAHQGFLLPAVLAAEVPGVLPNHRSGIVHLGVGTGLARAHQRQSRGDGIELVPDDHAHPLAWVRIAFGVSHQVIPALRVGIDDGRIGRDLRQARDILALQPV